MSVESAKNGEEHVFTNQVVNVCTLSTNDMTLHSLSHKYRKINLLLTFFFALFFTTILSIFYSGLLIEFPITMQAFVIPAYSLIAVVFLCKLSYHLFADPLKKFALREHDLNYQSGLVFRSVVSQPILRIQHIEVKRGPIERKAGLATLQVFSAGGISHTFTIPGLDYNTAISMRQFILNHKDIAADV